MSKAVYTTKNIGHYGLAFDYYTHFTSPIRRYPDVLVHRLLESYINGHNNINKEALEEACIHSSSREQLATKAERDSIKYMQVKFMEDKIDQCFEGVISGVTDRGIYVEILENKCEGFIKINEINIITTKGSIASPIAIPKEPTAIAVPLFSEKYRAIVVTEICDVSPCPVCLSKNTANIKKK